MTTLKKLPDEGFVKLSQIQAVIPVSKSTWYRGMESGVFPRPIKLSERAVGWRVEEIRDCIKRLGVV
jgi:predicted DNA-binding transcriptional regulator AlpA